MGQLSRKHRKNRGERYAKRKVAQLARHQFNQAGRPQEWHKRMFLRLVFLR